MLPPLIESVTTYVSRSKILPSLKELCLRCMWKEKQKCTRNPQISQGYKPFCDVTSDMLPSSLCDMINVGPVAQCDMPTCRAPIFTHASVTVIPVYMSARRSLEGKLVPVVLYFCCDSCAELSYEDLQRMTDELSMWLYRRAASACRIEFI